MVTIKHVRWNTISVIKGMKGRHKILCNGMRERPKPLIPRIVQKFINQFICSKSSHT